MMTVEKLIKELENLNMPKAEVRLNDIHGSTALFALALANPYHKELSNVVWIESKDDIDMGNELEARFENASKSQMDELDFFMDLLETGFTLDDIKKYLPEKYEYSKNFMEEHGLIQKGKNMCNAKRLIDLLYLNYKREYAELFAERRNQYR